MSQGEGTRTSSPPLDAVALWQAGCAVHVTMCVHVTVCMCTRMVSPLLVDGEMVLVLEKRRFRRVRKTLSFSLFNP